ncbi:MAG: zinc-binding dehydrogenase [Dehalococcoidia bacterium]
MSGRRRANGRLFPWLNEGRTVRVVTFDHFGGPAALRTEHADDPAPGPGELRLRLISSPVNRADLAMLAGRYGVRPTLPATPGLEAAGIVDATGSDVRSFVLGDRVLVALGGAAGQGTWRDLLIIPESAALRIPDGVSDEVAASCLVPGLTAWALLSSLALPDGATLLVTAALSSAGVAVGQLASSFGLRPFGVLRSSDSADRAVSEAGFEAVGFGPVPRFVDVGPFDAALDCVGGDWTAACLELLRPGGEVVLFGELDERRLTIDPGRLIFAEKRLRGFWLDRWLARSTAEERDAAYALVLALLEAGTLQPIVDRVFPLDQAGAACRYALLSGRVGRVFLRP